MLRRSALVCFSAIASNGAIKCDVGVERQIDEFKEYVCKPRIGFGSIDNSDKADESIKAFFRPEFRSRIDAIIKFNKLGYNELEKVVIKVFDDIVQLLNKQKIKITLDDTALKYFTEKAMASNSGARIVASLLDDQIKPLLAEILIYLDAPKENYTVKYIGEKIVID